MKNLNSKLKQLSKTKNVSENVDVAKIFNTIFMMKFTKFQTLTDFINNSPYSNFDEFVNADVAKRDKYVSEFTNFSSWLQMEEKAVSEYLGRSLF